MLYLAQCLPRKASGTGRRSGRSGPHPSKSAHASLLMENGLRRTSHFGDQYSATGSHQPRQWVGSLWVPVKRVEHCRTMKGQYLECPGTACALQPTKPAHLRRSTVNSGRMTLERTTASSRPLSASHCGALVVAPYFPLCRTNTSTPSPVCVLSACLFQMEHQADF